MKVAMTAYSMRSWPLSSIESRRPVLGYLTVSSVTVVGPATQPREYDFRNPGGLDASVPRGSAAATVPIHSLAHLGGRLITIRYDGRQ